MIYTGYYANMKKIPEGEEYRFISISRGNPSWFDKPLYDLSPLKPSWDLVNIGKANNYVEYIKQYQAQLEQIGIEEVLKVLRGDGDVILLCYETPDKFCHRHIVKDWLNSYGIVCKEITF